jgi:hypothetical protein
MDNLTTTALNRLKVIYTTCDRFVHFIDGDGATVSVLPWTAAHAAEEGRQALYHHDLDTAREVFWDKLCN